MSEPEPEDVTSAHQHEKLDDYSYDATEIHDDDRKNIPIYHETHGFGKYWERKGAWHVGMFPTRLSIACPSSDIQTNDAGVKVHVKHGRLNSMEDLGDGKVKIVWTVYDTKKFRGAMKTRLDPETFDGVPSDSDDETPLMTMRFVDLVSRWFVPTEKRAL